MFEKLDAYDVVANLVPGAALTYALHFSKFPTPAPADWAAFLLVAFVAGVTTNRLGSLVLDPVLRRLKFLNPKDYDSFVASERADKKLETLVANHGLYRTFFTAGLIYLILVVGSHWFPSVASSNQLAFTLFVIGGMIVFLFAFRKEDGYIHTRIEAAKKPRTETAPEN
jgi:hypothetical protein